MGLYSGLLSTQDSSDIPVMLTGISASSGNKANATATATLAAQPGMTAYVTGFQVTACGATAANAVTSSLSGVVGGTLSYAFAYPAGNTVAALNLIVSFYPALAAAAAGQAISISLPPSGSGGTNAAASIQGFYL